MTALAVVLLFVLAGALFLALYSVGVVALIAVLDHLQAVK